MSTQDTLQEVVSKLHVTKELQYSIVKSANESLEGKELVLDIEGLYNIPHQVLGLRNLTNMFFHSFQEKDSLDYCIVVGFIGAKCQGQIRYIPLRYLKFKE